MESNANMGVSIPIYGQYPSHKSHAAQVRRKHLAVYDAHIQSNCCQAQTDSKPETLSEPAHAGTLVTVLSLLLR